jgi:hypothetical protein
MGNRLLKCIYRVIIGACLLLTTVEITAQFLFYPELGEAAYLAGKFASHPSTPDLHHPRTELITDNFSLYDWEADPFIKKHVFSTDEFGTIKPSSLSLANSEHQPYAFFCGGSTTECAVVPEGLRVPDIYSTISGHRAVNASKSGKDIHGCVSTIRHIFSDAATVPALVVIATSTNTLTTFATVMTSHLRPPQDLQPALPGVVVVVDKINALFRASQVVARSPQTPPEFAERYPEYERSLFKGCCYGPAMFNRHHSEIDWLSEGVQEAYSAYVQDAIHKFTRALGHAHIPRDAVAIFIEPNSFGFENIAAKHDYRQRLYGYDGKELSLSDSLAVVSLYDHIYEREFRAAGYQVLRVPDNYLSGVNFYDAIHLTKSGSQKIGEFYAHTLPEKRSPDSP